MSPHQQHSLISESLSDNLLKSTVLHKEHSQDYVYTKTI